jgi:hypothetical protein
MMEAYFLGTIFFGRSPDRASGCEWFSCPDHFNPLYVSLWYPLGYGTGQEALVKKTTPALTGTESHSSHSHQLTDLALLAQPLGIWVVFEGHGTHVWGRHYRYRLMIYKLL